MPAILQKMSISSVKCIWEKDRRRVTKYMSNELSSGQWSELAWMNISRFFITLRRRYLQNLGAVGDNVIT